MCVCVCVCVLNSRSHVSLHRFGQSELFHQADGEAVLFTWVNHLSEYMNALPPQQDMSISRADVPTHGDEPGKAHTVGDEAKASTESSGQLEEVESAHFDILSGEPMTDRKSVFQVRGLHRFACKCLCLWGSCSATQAHACHVYSLKDVDTAMACLLQNRKVARATHNIMVRGLSRPWLFQHSRSDTGVSHCGY